MPTNTLSDHVVKRTGSTDRPQKLFDGHGLFLAISPTGSKIWRVAYRLHGKPQTATLGAYPLVTLSQARILRDELRKKLLDGTNPKATPKSQSLTLKEAVDAYWGGRSDVAASYKADAMRGLEMHLYKTLRDTPMAVITKDDLLAALNVMDKARLFVYVRRVRMWVSQVFDWAIEQGHCTDNPAAKIRPERAFGKRREVSHAALDFSELPAFFARLALENDLQSVYACKMLALTWVRTGELRQMLWTEIDGDTWRIPAGKMKRGLELLVPLSKQALEILDILKARSQGSVYVFPAHHTPDRPMSENAVLYLIHRIGYKDRMTGHGWRSVGSTWANENGYPADAIERQLAHVPDDKIRAVYNRAEFLPQRRKMLQDWADCVDRMQLRPNA